MGVSADRFILLLLLSSLFLVNCGDEDDDDDDQQTAEEEKISDINPFSDSLNDVVIDGENIYRFPRFSQFFSDNRFEYYWLYYQCFQYGEDHGGKLIVQSYNGGVVDQHNLEDLDGDMLRSEDDPDIMVPRISSIEGRFWGCYIAGNFGKARGVSCSGNLQYEKSYSDKWGDLTGTTRVMWECKFRQPNPLDPTKRLRYKQQVACEGLLMNPPNSDQTDNCEVRRWQYAVDDWGSIEANGSSALFDPDSHLGSIDGLDEWDSSCCRQQGGDEEIINWLKIYEASTMSMKQSVLAVWAQASQLWSP